MRVLGIESSCDELSFGIVEPDEHTVSANVVHSQIDLHRRFGGIVPEVASRDHVRRLEVLLQEALDTASCELEAVDGLAVTCGPGLVGSLLCGIEFAKGLALATKRPFLGVHHLEGHLCAPELESEGSLGTPFTCLLVSGGHTQIVHVEAPGGPYRILGRSRDDAAGEAFDKSAKLLGLGYPGGPAIDRLAEEGDPDRYDFPTMMAGKDNLDFSFSGLKTHVRRRVEESADLDLADFCAGLRRAIVDNLLRKALRAARETRALVIVGGVAANRLLRSEATRRSNAAGIALRLPSKDFCTDNGAMIARAGQRRLMRGQRSSFGLDPRARWPLETLR
ncbi:MAG: tRNA (adenosine(37)-N6)-threonylcarbamoyltransferase complex transferase subunit TsaD [Myxococcota bacterium]